MKKLAPLVLLLLAGCEQPAPAAPSPAMQALQQSCAGGNLDSCTTLAQIESREREAQINRPPFVFQPTYIDPAPFMTQPQQYRPPVGGSTTYCRRGMGGQSVFCNSF